MSVQLDNLMMNYPLTLTHFFERSRRLWAKKTLATRVPGQPLHRYTYADFAARTMRLAGALKAFGLTKGDRVATFAWNIGTMWRTVSFSEIPNWSAMDWARQWRNIARCV